MIFATPPFGLAAPASNQLKKLAICAVLAIGLKGVALAANPPIDASAGGFLAPSLSAVEPEREVAPWIGRIRDWVEEEYDVPAGSIEPALIAAETEGRPLGIDPLLIVAIMATESGFNPRAVSKMGAKGLMQVIPRFHQDKIGKPGKNALFDPQFNVRIGTLVLHEAITRFGSTAKALQYYNGSLGDPTRSYTRKVMALRHRLHNIASARTETPLG